jgi:hypothetical protein
MNTSRHQFNNEYDGDSVCVNVEAVELHEILNAFERYLRACGFHFDGHVTICQEDGCPHVTAPADLDPIEDGKEGV